jgi:uncharacterized membrane protein
MAHQPTPSKAAIKGHPIHPMLIPFPIAFITAALVTDIVYLSTSERVWALASAWLLWAGVVMGAVAGAAGAIDFFATRIIREHRAAQLHGGGNVLIVLLTLGNAVLRLDNPGGAVAPWGVTLTAVAAALLAVTGWIGGDLSYKHMFGVNPHQMTEGSPALGSQERS